MSDKYSCQLSFDNDHSSENENTIAGNHEASKTDGNVEVLQTTSMSNLEYFSSDFCSKFPNLQVIELVNLKISTIEADALQKCTNLKILEVNSARIAEIPESLLIENSELIEIEFSSNDIKSVNQGTFEQQENLVKLSLKNNKIEFLPSKVFNPLTNLEFLNLNGNQIGALDPNLFKELSKLKKLSLNSNKIAELPSGVFKNLGKLQMLELNSNQLNVINSNSFGIHSHLFHVDFNDNKIFAVDPIFFNRGPINTLMMERNECLDDIVSNRQDEDLQTCYDNFNDGSLVPNLTPETTSSTTTTTSKPPSRPKTRPPTRPPSRSTTKATTVFPNKPTILSIKLASYSAGEYPWVAAIMLKDSLYQCGGVMVSDTRVVTAASCMYLEAKNRELLPRDITIVLGSRRIFTGFETGKSSLAVHRYRIHPDFDRNFPMSSANIAVLFLEGPFKSNRFIKPIGLERLPPRILSITDAVYVAHGVKESLKSKSSVTAGYLQTSIFDNQSCPSSKKDEWFCISEDNEFPTCLDVIGSGLFVRHNNKFYLRGILTYVSGSCDIDSYSLFTDVSSYKHWIENVDPEDFDELDY